MFDLYTWTTPNGRKLSIALEELALPYNVHAIDIGAGDQHSPAFLAINPNNKIPALVDTDTGAVLTESGSALLYLGQKTGRLAPPATDPGYWPVVNWVMWQMGGQGPMLGQAHHFLRFNPGVSAYAAERYGTEAARLYRVLDTHLTDRLHVAGDLSIADIAIWPWVSRFDYQQIDLGAYPAVRDWYLRLADRPAFQRGYAVPSDTGPIPRP